MLHYKSLKREEASGHIPKGEGEESSADLGKIVNLMQGDSYAVAQRFWEFSGLITAPVRITIAMIFLYKVLGWSALLGVAIVGITYILNYPLAKYNISITRSSWKAKDRRMKLVDELLQNIRFLKFYGWEYDWSRKTEDARETELKWRVKNNIVDTADMDAIWDSLGMLSVLHPHRRRTPHGIKGVHFNLSVLLFAGADGCASRANIRAYVSMQRIEEFLKENEVPLWACSLERSVTPPATESTHDTADVGFKAAAFEWESGSASSDAPARFQLGPLDVVFPQGKLSIISGATGSGKSALLEALLGEMHCISGTVIIDKSNHRVAYCAQSPWLEHATIKDNILFGCTAPFDEERYHKVIYSCALEQDLSILDAGDMTEIGEKGITLSGGQRARVALARALYSRAEVLLLDDPLAAVDMHTAQHIVKNCFSGPLSEGRTIILVTHHITLCVPSATYLVELKEGKILHQGTTDELRSRGLLQAIVEEEEKPFQEASSSHTPTDVNVDESKGFAAARPSGNGKLVEAEHRAEGRVSLKTYLTYIRAAGVSCWILTFVLQVTIRVINIANQVFLAKWGEAYEESASTHPFATATITIPFNYPWSNLPSPNVDVTPWLKMYFYIATAGGLLIFFYIALGYYVSLQASRALFIALLRRLTRAPLRFFDTTPVGRILNRFTSDINIIDGALQGSARNCLAGTLNFLASFGVMLALVPAFAPWALFIAWLYIRLAPPYIRAARDLRRLESVALSPAFAGFDELLRGITHIRAFGMENRYQDNFYRKVDKFQTFDHVYWLVNNWLSWRYDCKGKDSTTVRVLTIPTGLGSVVVFAATFFALYQGISDGSAGLVIVQAAVFAEASRRLVRVAAQLELDFNSVERVVEYLDVPQEAPAIIPDHRPPAYWPSNSGSLVVQDLEVKYAPHLPSVLRNISFSVNPGEKIGVKYSDEERMAVLERCHLTSRLAFRPSEAEPTLLDMRVGQNSLSAGEKQLLALARAVLRGTNIIIMDEATSQIDTELDDKIQKTIREETAGAIVITIAHRLKTVMDYDRILVLSEGEIAEFDTPAALLKKDGGSFQSICKQSSDWGIISRIGSTI
ncbi:hypothetical protein EST38_g1810 [Candolleomyces aberdarensis]|uniref:P-loop containing nucleoside triphosphate hydrolase protein n=1 Tax=Candolleomyces aberdarensis TaxID=2316362 RepID=A0A4Q2DU27_9AGAR|nr:hypothetical protein EST38_g1810 [Candolleomyces aberdarensis]